MHRERRHIVRLLLLRFNADDVERRTATFTQLLFPPLPLSHFAFRYY